MFRSAGLLLALLVSASGQDAAMCGRDFPFAEDTEQTCHQADGEWEPAREPALIQARVTHAVEKKGVVEGKSVAEDLEEGGSLMEGEKGPTLAETDGQHGDASLKTDGQAGEGQEIHRWGYPSYGYDNRYNPHDQATYSKAQPTYDRWGQPLKYIATKKPVQKTTTHQVEKHMNTVCDLATRSCHTTTTEHHTWTHCVDGQCWTEKCTGSDCKPSQLQEDIKDNGHSEVRALLSARRQASKEEGGSLTDGKKGPTLLETTGQNGTRYVNGSSDGKPLELKPMRINGSVDGKTRELPPMPINGSKAAETLTTHEVDVDERVERKCSQSTGKCTDVTTKTFHHIWTRCTSGKCEKKECFGENCKPALLQGEDPRIWEANEERVEERITEVMHEDA